VSEAIFSKRAILLTGKGGVGRTTVAAALALAAAKRGKRVLIAEVGEPDVDHSPLGAVFGRNTLPKEPVELLPGISGVMVWSRMGHERFLRMVLPIPALVRAALRSGALRRMLDAAPSLNELGVFYHMHSLVRENASTGEADFDLFIVDLPATGHALGMAHLPENILSIIPSGPIHRAMKDGMEVFFNKDVSAMYIVTLPEALPVTECVELLEGLESTEMPIGGVIVNKVHPDDFSEEERHDLACVFEGRQVFGETRFLGLSKVESALKTLEARVKLPILRLPEAVGEGLPLAKVLSNAFNSEDNQ
jgi:anion-transporting  ArsA/GET3 family ATPase